MGYTIVAASTTIGAVAGGEVIYGIGNTGIDLGKSRHVYLLQPS
jgi:hypothetical protein